MTRRFGKGEHGGVAVEGAILVPLLILMTFGAVDASLLFIHSHRVEAGLTAGGSYLAQSQANGLDELRARRIAVTGTPNPGGKSRLKGWSETDVTISYKTVPNAGNFRGSADVRVAKLTTATPFRGFGILSGVTGGSLELKAEYETRLIR